MSSVSRVKSAERTLDVLELLADARRPLPTMVVARRCGMPKSSTHHLLNVLRDRGWATYHSEQRGWTIGPAAQVVAHGDGAREWLRWVGGPVLLELVEATGFTAQLVVLEGGDVLFLDRRSPGDRDPGLLTAPGVRIPAARTAAGRALLMHLPVAQLRALFGSGQFTVAALLHELVDARARGIAESVSGVTPGVRCLAAAVPGPAGSGAPLAALAISMPATASTPDDERELVGALRAAVERLNATLAAPSGRALRAA